MKYTPDEIAKLLANRPNQPHYVKALITKCVKAAVLAEREACAQICDAASEPRKGYSQTDEQWAASTLAERIRARGNP